MSVWEERRFLRLFFHEITLRLELTRTVRKFSRVGKETECRCSCKIYYHYSHTCAKRVLKISSQLVKQIYGHRSERRSFPKKCLSSSLLQQ